MTLFKNCVFCLVPVDVDNPFGTIDEDEVFCPDHEDLGQTIIELHHLKKKIHNTEKEFTKQCNEIERSIITAVRKELKVEK